MDSFSEIDADKFLELTLHLQTIRNSASLLDEFTRTCVSDLGYSGCALIPHHGNKPLSISGASDLLSEALVESFSICEDPGQILSDLGPGVFREIATGTHLCNAGKAGFLVISQNDQRHPPINERLSNFVRIFAELYGNLTAYDLLQEQKNRLEMASKAGRIGTWELNAETLDVLWDDQMFSLYEIAKESFNGRFESFRSSIHPEDLNTTLASIQSYIESGAQGPIDIQFRIITPQGKVKKIAGYADAKRNLTGQLILVGVNYDITEIETARTQSLYRSQIETILINLSLKVIRSGPDDLDRVTDNALEMIGKFVGADRAYRFSYDFERYVASNTHEWCNDDIMPEIDNLQDCPVEDIKIWVNSHKRGLPMLVNRVLDLPEGHGLRMILEPQGIRSLVTIPLMDGTDCVGFIGFDSVNHERHWNDIDISLLKLLADLLVNAEIKARNEKLIQQTQQALLESRDTARYLAKEAASANIAKSRFVASVSHEIRTPLHAILGIAELSETENDYTVLQSNIRTIKKSGTTLLELINDILDFSRTESNEITIKLQRFSIKTLVNRIHSTFDLLVQRKGISLDVLVSPSVPAVLVGDELRIHQIISNFLSNAIKFTRHGGIIVNIQSTQTTSPGASKPSLAHLKFKVTDTGSGIHSEDLERIFDPFFQTEESVSSHLGGTGLGLPIARLLATKMGGKISVQSVKNQGSSFIFEIALQISDNNQTDSLDSLEPAQETDLAGMKLLLAEDNPVNQLLVRNYLKESGCQLDIADNGKLAVEKSLSNTYDLILMDCRMPEMDGFEAARAIRSQEGIGQQTPILAVTASAMEEDKETCLQAGMDNVLTKPFTKTELLKAIRQFSQRS